VRPGTLYRMMGMPTASAIAVKCWKRRPAWACCSTARRPAARRHRRPRPRRDSATLLRRAVGTAAAITGIRPASRAFALRMSCSSSLRSSTGDSPVVRRPLRRPRPHGMEFEQRVQALKSIAPSPCMGVTSAGMLPLNILAPRLTNGDATHAAPCSARKPRVRRGLRPATLAAEAPMKQLIAISAIGSDRTGLVYDLTRVVVDCGGNILESRMTALGNEFATSCSSRATGTRWPSSRASSPSSPSRPGSRSRAAARKPVAAPDMGVLQVDVVCLDQPGVLHSLAGFFSSRGIDIATITTRTYNAAHTGAPMFSVYMIVHVPTASTSRRCARKFMTCATT